MDKRQHISATVAAAGEGKRTQQSTTRIEIDGFERVRLAGEEGDSNNNTTINYHRDNIDFIVLIYYC